MVILYAFPWTRINNYLYIDVFRNRCLPSYRSWTLGGVAIVRHYESVTIGCLH